MERYHLDSNKIEFQPKLYSRVKSEQQLEKEEDYGEEDLEPEDYLDMPTPAAWGIMFYNRNGHHLALYVNMVPTTDQYESQTCFPDNWQRPLF